MHTSACFEIANKCKISKFAEFKFKDFSRIFKYFQAPYLFSSTFKGVEVFIPNSSIFKDFSSMLWTLSFVRGRRAQMFMETVPDDRSRLPTVAVLSTARSLRPAEWRRAEPVTTTTRHLPYFSSSSGQNHDRISEVHNTLQCHQRKEPRP